MFLKLVLVFELLLMYETTVDAKCNECSVKSYAACLNETAFRVCYDGKTASDQIISCPKDKVCTSLEGVCKPRMDVSPDCGNCNVCSLGIACVSQTQFEYCVGNVRTGIIAECPKGQFCNLLNLVLNGNICSLSCTTSPTCYADNFISTPPPAADYNSLCTATVDRGYYENIYDSSCKTYIYCEMFNGIMHSVLYNCTSGFFSINDQKCVDTKPNGCK